MLNKLKILWAHYISAFYKNKSAHFSCSQSRVINSPRRTPQKTPFSTRQKYFPLPYEPFGLASSQAHLPCLDSILFLLCFYFVSAQV